MSWEYLKTEDFDIRYYLASIFVKGDTILDLNCGEPRFKNYIDYETYIANDINQPDDINDIDFRKEPDALINEKSDILCLFGYGGGEYTGEKLESQTIKYSFLRNLSHNPKYVVVEMVQDWEDKYEAMSWFKQQMTDYDIIFEAKYTVEPIKEFYHRRMITIWKMPTT